MVQKVEEGDGCLVMVRTGEQTEMRIPDIFILLRTGHFYFALTLSIFGLQ
jgi:hypothetical protein